MFYFYPKAGESMFSPGDNPIRSVDGKSVKCPSKYEYVLSDISKSDAGRTEDTVMHKGKVGQTISLNVGWESLTTAELSTLLKQFDKEYISLVYLDAKAGDFLTAEFYVGDRASPMYNSKLNLWDSLEFSIIKQSGK